MDKSQQQILTAYGYTFKAYQPWQFGIFHPDITDKFVWYPKKGALMRDGVNTFKIGMYQDVEDVITQMNKYLP